MDKKTTDIERVWLSPAEASIYVGLTEATLAKYRHYNKGPKYKKPSGKIYYFKEDLDAYLRGE